MQGKPVASNILDLYNNALRNNNIEDKYPWMYPRKVSMARCEFYVVIKIRTHIRPINSNKQKTTLSSIHANLN